MVRKVFSSATKIILPLILATAILWWMYRGIKWDDVKQAFGSEMSWTWMLLSFPFGIMAQVFRALRWKLVLEPMGEKPRLHTCINAVFISYASSLIVPRVGEMLRCGILRRWERTNFSKGIGTVVTERVIDSAMVMLLALITILCQIPLFYCFQYTAQLGAMAALVAFVVGCFAVLVPTPNGAGPWHFAVKTVLVLYGVSQINAALFVLVVHTIQTLLVVALGLYGVVALFLTKKTFRS